LTALPYKAALITGAARRIGRAIALSLASKGIAVAVHYHGSRNDADKTVSDIEKAGGKAVAVAADLAQETDLKALVPLAAKSLEHPIDILINNAALFDQDDLFTLTADSWDKHQKVNLRAPVLLTQALVSKLPEETSASIINIIDQRVLKLNPQYISYTASKAGLWAITQTTAQALAPKGIRVNAIGPGPTLPNTTDGQEGFQKEAANVPLGEGPSLNEISRAVHFILESSSMTGQMIALDGGQHLAWRTEDILKD